MLARDPSPFPPGAHVCAYFRDSGGDDQDLSVDQQEHFAVDWCRENDVILSRTFADRARPASSTVGREKFDEMLTYFQNDAPEAGLIIWRASRFARNLDDAQYYRADLRRRGFIVYSLNDKIPAGKEGRFFEAALDYWNEKFLEQLSEEVKRGLHDNLVQYGVVPGTPPRGFMRETVQIGSRRSGKPHLASKWVPDPAVIPLVKQAWLMRCQGRSFKEIQDATHLYSSINSWNTFFSNRLYIGELVFGGTVIPNYCQPVIDIATWNAVQAISAKRSPLNLDPDSPNHPRRAGSSGLLSGLLICERCNAPMSVDVVRPKSGTAPSYYYRCTRAVRNRTCDMKRVPLPWVEFKVLETVKTYLLDPRNLENFASEVEKATSTNIQRLTAERDEQTAALARIEQKIDNTADAISDSGKSKALINKLHTLEAEQAETQKKLAIAETNIRQNRAPAEKPDPAALSAYMLNRLEQAKNDPKEQKRILRSFIIKIKINRETRIISGEIIYGLPKTSPREPEKEPPHSDIIMPTLSPSMGAHYHRHKFSFPIKKPRSK